MATNISNTPLLTTDMALLIEKGDILVQDLSFTFSAPKINNPVIVLASAKEIPGIELTENTKSKLQKQLIGMIIPVTIRETLFILWSAGNRWRLHRGLHAKVFCLEEHEESQRLRDSAATLENELSKVLEKPEIISLPLPALDHLLQLIRDLKLDQKILYRVLNHILATWTNEDLGWCRLGDVMIEEGKWKLAALSYRCAQERVPVSGEKRRAYYLNQLRKSNAHCHAGWAFRQNEVDALDNLPVDTSIRKILLEGGTISLELPNRDYETELYGVDGEPVLIPYPKSCYKLPRFFSWLIPHALAGISTPRNNDDISAFERMGFTLVITLTAEEPLPARWFLSRRTIRNEFFPTANYYAPIEVQMDQILSMIYEEIQGGGSVLVHCGGGKGRAGTVLTCYVALFGLSRTGNTEYGPPKMSSGEAIDLIRGLRPGSIETKHQEEFIQQYISLAWKRYGAGEPLFGDLTSLFSDDSYNISSREPTLEINGDISNPDIIMLVGIQGSGKSHFSKLLRLRNSNAQILSPDTIAFESSSGSGAATRAFEISISNFRPHRASDRVIILDRTNPTPGYRTRILSLPTCTTSLKIIAVHFDLPTKLCQTRAQLRSTHPTLPPWRVESAIKSTSPFLVPPNLSEGFSGIATVRSTSAAETLANTLFGSLKLQKFPRTLHLLNLGSVTRDDLILPSSDAARLFAISHPLVVTEKIDGANLGFSLSFDGHTIRVQNRSHYIDLSSYSAEHPQFRQKLQNWVTENGDKIRRVLMPNREAERMPERYVLFGEWAVATHTVVYNSLPDYFMAFDIWDRLESGFLEWREVRGRVEAAELRAVPVIWEGRFEGDWEEWLRGLVEMKSVVGSEKREGVVARFGNGERGKVVREGFLEGEGGEEVKHWRQRGVRWNKLAREGESTPR